MKTKTIGMTYDGPADNNPFAPRAGNVVARCSHEPRPMHVRIYIATERPVVEGVTVEWMNLCRSCKEVEAAGTRISLTLHTWTAEDVEQVKAAGRD
jgi:hypothetical protein